MHHERINGLLIFIHSKPVQFTCFTLPSIHRAGAKENGRLFRTQLIYRRCKMLKRTTIYFLFLIAYSFFILTGAEDKVTFKAAVLDQGHKVNYSSRDPPTRDETLQLISSTIQLYWRKANEASAEGVDIIVFPEYGIIPRGLSRNTIEPFLEQVPDPGVTLCTDREAWPDAVVLRALSCIARHNSIYVVANVGDIIPCNPQTDKQCPRDSRYQYNTNVAFDSMGKLLMRYHKYNLFWEFHYDKPPVPEMSYFDTPFGRFGTIICFDILFKDPAVTLIDTYGIDTVLFPTAWMNVLPHLSAVPFHQGFAIGNQVNVLGANIHDPANRFCGSGIYGSNSTVTYRNDETSSRGKLLIGNLFSKPRMKPDTKNEIEPYSRGDARLVPYSSDSVENLVQKGESDFSNEVFGDIFNFVWIPTNASTGEAVVCHGILCCRLSYGKDAESEEHFAFGAFRGLHTKEGTYFIEVCALIKCASKEPRSCGDRAVTSSSTHFSPVRVSANYHTPHVYPMVITDGISPADKPWEFDPTSKDIVVTELGRPLVSVISFAREFDYDTTMAVQTELEAISSGSLGLSHLTIFLNYYFATFLMYLINILA